jgi:hypothetical protein
VHVRVDEAGYDVPTRCVDRLGALVPAEPRHDAVADRDVDVEPLAREDSEHTTAADDEVGRLVSAGDGKAAPEVDHPEATYYPWARGRPDSALARRSPAAQGRAA